MKKNAGDWLWALTTRHQHDKLDLNDLGFLTDPNHYAVQAWLTRAFNDDTGERLFNGGEVNLRWYHSWIYADRRMADPENPGAELWSYASGHDLIETVHGEAYAGMRNHWGLWAGCDWGPDITDLFATRWLPDDGGRGPLMENPRNIMAWIGFHSDGTRTLSMELNLAASADRAGARGRAVELDLDWVQNSRVGHDLSLEYSWHHDDAQWVMNQPSAGGIGGVSYVFAELDRRVWDLTLRSRLLFNRDQSLELYLQPFLAVGDYSNAKELARPDSYAFTPYSEAGWEVTDEDFSFGAVNVNVVYRWEYRPGSTLFLVWSHSRYDEEYRGLHGGDEPFRNDFRMAPLFDNEPENRIMAKVSYWLPV